MTDQLATIPEGRAERTAFWTRHIEELAQSTLPQRATVVLSYPLVPILTQSLG